MERFLHRDLSSAGFFTIATITDFFDGYIARKYDQITNFGKMMDPIADKFLILSAFFIFARMYLYPMLLFYIICAREIGITLIRLVAMSKGQVLAAEQMGKLKTVTQFIAIYVLFLSIIIPNTNFLEYIQLDNLPQVVLEGLFIVSVFILPFVNGLMYFVTFITVISGISFLWNNRKIKYV